MVHLFSKSPLRLGILGGGQLGRMLLPVCQRFGIQTTVLDLPGAPCEKLCDRFAAGSFTDTASVQSLRGKVDLVTIEIENVSTAGLRTLAAEGVKVRPDADLIDLIKDKGRQKQFFEKHGFPTAPFELISNQGDLESSNIGFPVIQKLREGGYDGRGVRRLLSRGDAAEAFDSPSVLERPVSIEKELSLQIARSSSGETQIFPIVEMVFHNDLHLLDLLLCPARVEASLTKEASRIATGLAEQLSLVGLLTVEFFLTDTGKLLVNELAPRPHNSGHHTIEACVTSQFEQHLRAITDLPLGSTELREPAVMVNLLGAPGSSGPAQVIGLEEVARLPKTYLHLYGKAETRPGRKMGHVTILGNKLDEAIQMARKVQSCLTISSR